MVLARWWWLALAACLVCFSLGCNESVGSRGGAGGAGGMGGMGGAGGQCPTEATNACLTLQNCCRDFVYFPVFLQACNDAALEGLRDCDKTRCDAVLAGYPQCAPEPDAGVGGGGGSANP